ncbi:unnamed protein product [Pleuronectes platessa]|uniref:Uncharacterized protein n=1 Tax=Pleuronectes platessa TaxID=8262 RepID=A0A9N7VWW3_PLEPL|nr:unnamed protein product [Pleuronectes platessa]
MSLSHPVLKAVTLLANQGDGGPSPAPPAPARCSRVPLMKPRGRRRCQLALSCIANIGPSGEEALTLSAAEPSEGLGEDESYFRNARHKGWMKPLKHGKR